MILHRHHVVPKHAGGSNAASNMTCPLTISEHADHHRYRYEMLGEYWDWLAWKGLSGQIAPSEIEELSRQHHRIGMKHSPETKEKIRSAITGRKHSPEAREKVRRARLGFKFTPEQLATRRIAWVKWRDARRKRLKKLFHLNHRINSSG